MLGPIDVLRLATGKWIQLRGHHVDLTVGDLHISGTIDLDLRIGDQLEAEPKPAAK